VWLSVSVVVGLVAAVAPRVGRGEELQSFYVREGDEIISVESVGEDVRVRVMRVASASEYCREPLVVEAVERVLPRTTVQAVAGVRICSLSQATIDAALARAREPGVSYVDYFGSAHTIVANCGGTEKVLEMDDHGRSYVDFDMLRHKSREVFGLWRVGERAAARLLNKRINPDEDYFDLFDEHAAAAREPREALGASLVPELRSAKYRAAFDDELTKRLEGYTGPPADREPRFVSVPERDTLPFTAFVMPRMPQIALSARVYGDIRLRLTVDPQSGDVRDLRVVTSIPLLTEAAVEAARKWRFDPTRMSREPIDVTVRFRLQCPSD
jgi:TonB family protein